MDIYPKYKSALGYQVGDNGIDSYGVNHNNFSLRDELEYQMARTNRESQLINRYNQQGINNNYPQQGVGFWGNSADNNYGFGSSNIGGNIENITNQLNAGGFNNQQTFGTNSYGNAANSAITQPNSYVSNAGMANQFVQKNNNNIFSGSTNHWNSNADNLGSNTNEQDIGKIRRQIFDGQNCGGMSSEFADKIAYAESRGNCKNNINDYGCVNSSNTAFGRYQMQAPALIDAGYMDKNKIFLPQTGIKNMQDFLNNPQAQEQAFCNFLEKADKYNENWNNYKYLGKNIQVGDLSIPITKDMMLAGTHREGARKLNEWLNDAKFQNNNLVRDSVYDQQDKKRRNITKRFKEILYPPK